MSGLAGTVTEKQKKAARTKAGYAVKKGILVPKPCEKCGNQKAHKHHADYSKPLDVIWLCAACHKRAHCTLKIGIYCPACASGQVYTRLNLDRVCRKCGHIWNSKEERHGRGSVTSRCDCSNL